MLNLNTTTTGEDSSSSGLVAIRSPHNSNLLHPREDDHNMNLDDPSDHRELNVRVQNYVMAEFVAVPSDFDVISHLSMREHVGLFPIKHVDTAQVKVISDAVANSPVFSTMNNAIIDPFSCFFFLQLMGELNLILKKIDNPLRRSQEEYQKFAERWKRNRLTYVRGQDVDRMSFLIVNIVPLLNQTIIDEAWESIIDLNKYQKEIDETNYKFD
ncbi:MAG: hypothetical protein ACTSX1_09190 [Candidatus Heimdallarchaeaceae archaeon]